MRLHPVLTAVSLVVAPFALTAAPAALNGVAVSSHGEDTGNAVEVRLPKAVQGRFVMLAAKTAANGKNQWCSAAEIRVLDADGKEIPPAQCSITGFSSEGDSTEAAANALDNNPDTIWHTRWQGGTPKPPHYIILDVGSVRAIGGIRVLPRKEGDNGNIGQYELIISDNGRDWDHNQPTAAGKLFGGAGPAPAFVKKTFATPGQIFGPVAIHVDARGRVWIAETYRYESQGIIQARGKARLELDELRLVTVEDHRRMIEVWKKEGEYKPFLDQKRVEWKDVDDFLNRFSEKVAYIEDTNGDGVADKRTEFIGNGLNDPVDGPMAGVLTIGSKVYATSIPHLILAEDTNGDGVASASERKILHTGFGPNHNFYGHDMHGLIQGPDGRIYWTIGDRSYYVKAEGKTFAGEGRGATFRCWPDGSGFEVFHVGLRNPQELAFNDFGDLFTGDNNCDAGDKARIVHVVEGGKTGWDMNVQSLKSRGPWLREAMWEMRKGKDDPTQPAWLLPPLAHVGHGPSGIMHNPGTGLPGSFDDCFLMANYPGEILAFNANPKGASYDISNNRRFMGSVNPSDVTMGYDGRIYVAHWGSNWPINKDPAIYTLSFEQEIAKPEVKEVQALFREGFEKLPAAKLAELLGHKDQRVRQEAHLALGEKARTDAAALASLTKLMADTSSPLLARIHAIWGTAFAARQQPDARADIAKLLKDKDAEIRSQAARVLGDVLYPRAVSALADIAKDDPSPRARFNACIALGKNYDMETIGSLIKLNGDKGGPYQYLAKMREELPYTIDHGVLLNTQLAIMEVMHENNGDDPYLRFAASYALARVGEPAIRLFFQQVNFSSPASLRLGFVLALRELKHPGVVRFLADPDAVVAAEAVRAIYDNRDTANFPALAALLDSQIPAKQRVDGVLRRVLAAAYRLGGEANAKRIFAFASDQDMPEALRLHALDLLESWDLPNDSWRNDDNTKRLAQAQSKGANELEKESMPSPRESVWGWWWPVPARQPGDGLKVLRTGANTAAQAASGKVKEKLLALDSRFGGPKSGPALLKLLADEKQPASYRIELLSTVDAAKKSEAVPAAQAALASTDAAVRSSARDLLARADAAAGLSELTKALTSKEIGEAQAAVATIGKLADPAAVKLLASMFEKINDGRLPEHLRVDVLLAAKTSSDATLKAAAEALDNALMAKTPEERFAMSLTGGSAERGRKVFLEHLAAQCQRCHKVGSEGASEAGPNLAGVAKRHDVKGLLQSIVNPGAVVAKGYGTVSVAMKDGTSVAGTLKDETADSLVIDTGSEKKTLRKADITSQTAPMSGMPPMAYLLNHAEVRDLVAYLSTLK